MTFHSLQIQFPASLLCTGAAVGGRRSEESPKNFKEDRSISYATEFFNEYSRVTKVAKDFLDL
jgi:hypothetical protein